MARSDWGPEYLLGIEEVLAQEIKQYDELFTLKAPKLKMITDYFVHGLNQGLAEECGKVPMNSTWVMGYPTGEEEGRILTLDMGGTNMRVCDVSLSKGQKEPDQIKKKFALPEEIKGGTGELLWDWVADRVEEFVHEHHSGGQGATELPLAFTFSFPVDQKTIRSGILQRWTKRFDVSGVDGQDIVAQLEVALRKKKVPAKILALINDTTGTLLASHYRDSRVKVGCVFGTGCNAAYMEECRFIPKLQHLELPEDAQVIINTEYGAFDRDLEVLPVTQWDIQIDRESLRPGTQRYEKMVAGLYMGEMLRIILLRLHEQGKIFVGLNTKCLRQPYVVDATLLSIAEHDTLEGLDEMRKEFERTFAFSPPLIELKVCRYLIRLIATRAARLYACGIAAICKKKDFRTCHVGVDGSVFNKYSGFKERARQGLREIFDWSPNEPDPIVLTPSEDGSSVGAALAAILALNGNGVEKVEIKTNGEPKE